MWPLSTALAHALAGRLDLAQPSLEALTPSDLRGLSRSTLWIANLTGICQLAALCHRPELAELVLELLQPLTGTHAVIAGLAYRGSVSFWQGLTLASLGQLEDAETHLRAAVLQHRNVVWFSYGPFCRCGGRDPQRGGGSRPFHQRARDRGDSPSPAFEMITGTQAVPRVSITSLRGRPSAARTQVARQNSGVNDQDPAGLLAVNVVPGDRVRTITTAAIRAATTLGATHTSRLTLGRRTREARLPNFSVANASSSATC